MYEPIDPRSLSKKEKSRYLTTAMGKPRLERLPSIINNDSDSDVDSEADLEAPLPEFTTVTQVDRKPTITIEKRQSQSPRERLEAELRKLDGFWSFKPIPRDTVFVGQTQARAAFTPAPSPNGSEVYLLHPFPFGTASIWIFGRAH